jgi:putative peptidoglycan lipid II flippase
LGHAVAYTFAALVGLVILRRRLGSLEGRRLAPILIQIVLAGVATGVVAWLVATWVGEALGTATIGPQILQVAGGMLAGSVTYLGIAAALRMPELRLIRQAVFGRMGRR